MSTNQTPPQQQDQHADAPYGDARAHENYSRADTTSEKTSVPQAQPFTLRVRIVQIIFLLLGVTGTLALAYWQWTRFTSAQGDFQNLGYALQWPLFGGFLILGYTKYIHYERERLAGEDQAAVSPTIRESMREIPDSFMSLPGQHKPTDLHPAEMNDDRRRKARNHSQ